MSTLTDAGKAIQAASRVATEQIQLQCGKAAIARKSKPGNKRLCSFFHHLDGGQRVKVESTLNGVLEVYATRGRSKTHLLARSKPGKWCVLASNFDTSVDIAVQYS